MSGMSQAVKVTYAAAGEQVCAPIVLPQGSSVAHLILELDGVSEHLGSCSTVLFEGQPLKACDPLPSSDAASAAGEISVELVVRPLLGRWSCTKGAAPAGKEPHDHHRKLIFLRADGSAAFYDHHKWKRDEANHGSVKKVVGLQPKEERQLDKFRADPARVGASWQLHPGQDQKGPVLEVMGAGHIATSIIEDDDLGAHGVRNMPRYKMLVPLSELWDSFEYSADE
ncbi:unnamed protein product [Effrenium voratum]|nr:unnamed protein product [Effrenium voratum]